MVDLKKLHPSYFEQLSLGLEIDELEDGDSQVVFTTEEKARRSMGAKVALEALHAEYAKTQPPAGVVSKEKDAKENDLFPWWDTYQQLLNSKWPWRIACFVAWASSPKLNRWPKTQDEFAQKVLGLTSDRVIATWRKKSPDIDGAISLLQSATMLEHRADVIKALVESASNSDHRSNPDRKLFFEMTGDYVPRSRVDLNTDPGEDEMKSKSESELMEIARRVKKTGDAETQRKEEDATQQMGDKGND